MAEEPSDVSVRGENPQLIRVGSSEQVNLAARLNPVLLRATTLVVYPIPPACYPNDRNLCSLMAEG
jgi:hypothetical protein